MDLKERSIKKGMDALNIIGVLDMRCQKFTVEASKLSKFFRFHYGHDYLHEKSELLKIPLDGHPVEL
jgi:hypothetical protein